MFNYKTFGSVTILKARKSYGRKSRPNVDTGKVENSPSPLALCSLHLFPGLLLPVSPGLHRRQRPQESPGHRWLVRPWLGPLLWPVTCICSTSSANVWPPNRDQMSCSVCPIGPTLSCSREPSVPCNHLFHRTSRLHV
jgi:hypothetical protein